MRKTILLVAIIVSHVSCEKKQCWTCTATTTMQASSTPTVKNVKETAVCDMTAAGIKEVEKSGTITDTIYYGNALVTHKTVTICQ